MVRIVFLFFLSVLSLNGLNAQISQDTIAVEETPMEWKFTKSILLDRNTHIPERTPTQKTLAWSWVNLGPNVLPKELNPGGKAIPKYAEGRGNGTGRINYLVQHPKHHEMLWACSPTGGAWVSIDGGEHWTIAGTDQLPISGVSSLSPHKRRKDTWFLATGDGDDLFQFSDGVWRTRDGGQTYESINGEGEYSLPFGKEDDYYTQVCEVKSNPKKSDVLVVASSKGLYISMNALGKKPLWQKVADGYFYSIQFIPGRTRSKDVIVASGDIMMISKDGGKSWHQVNHPEYPGKNDYPFLRMSIAWSKNEPQTLFVAMTCSKAVTQSSLGEGTLWSMDLATESWTMIRSLKSDMNNVIPTRARAFGVNPTDARMMMCGNVQPLYRSTDRGLTFVKIEKNQMHDDCHHILFGQDGKTVWASHDGGVSKSVDGGITFKPADTGIGAANIFGVSTSQTTEPQILYGGYDVGGNLLKDGQWWHVSWGDGFETIISPSDPKIMFTTMQNGNLQRSDDGRTFETGSNAQGAKTEWHTWIRMHPTNHTMVFCSGAKLSRSSDTGKTWKTIFEAAKADKALYNTYRFFLSESHPGVLYAYVLDTTKIQPQIWRTFNVTEPNEADIKWEKVADVPIQGWIMSIEVDPEDPKRFWMLYGSNERTGKLWYFNGTNYEDITANLGYSKCESMVLQRGPEKRLYVGSNYGVYTRRNGESQWTLMTGLPGTQIKTMAINHTANKLVVGTFGRGVWWGDLIQR
jgi:hypothetical protein